MAKQPQPPQTLMEMVGGSLSEYLDQSQAPVVTAPAIGRVQEDAPAPPPKGKKGKLDEDAFQFNSFWGASVAKVDGSPPAPPEPPPSFDPEEVDFRKSEDEQRCVGCQFYDREPSVCRVLRSEVNGDDLCDLFCGAGWGGMPQLSNDERVLFINGLVASEGAADLVFDGLAVTEFGPYILGTCNDRRFALSDGTLLGLLQQCGWVAGDVMAAVQTGREAVAAEDEGEGQD